MRRTTLIFIQIIVGAIFLGPIACSPTKFAIAPNDICNPGDSVCTIVDNFKVGSGKVDILFINDNSASMSVNQRKLSDRFAGFIQSLDQRDIDYNIAMVTTDLNASTSQPLVKFANGNTVLTRSDKNKINLFNSAIRRQETLACEDFIKSMYYTFGPGFQSEQFYNDNYYNYCPSNDERGIHTAYNAIEANVSSFIRPDAHLNIIAIANEDLRSGLYNHPTYSTQFPLETRDRHSNFSSMIASKYPNKYWNFNSIIAKDNACVTQQNNSFTDKNNKPIKNDQGNYVLSANIGTQYAGLSMSAMTNIDGNNAPRGKVLNICDNDYASHFSTLAAHITDAARMHTLKCIPMEAPTVTDSAGNPMSHLYTWNGSNQIVFSKGSEGIAIKITYRCYTGVK